MASKCLSCSKGVTTRSKAVQCSECDGWMHIACCGICPDQYMHLQRFTSPAINFFCDNCRASLNCRRLLAGLSALSIDSSSPTKPDTIHDTSAPPCSPSTSTSGWITPIGKRSRTTSTTHTDPSTQILPTDPTTRSYAAVVRESAVSVPICNSPTTGGAKSRPKPVEKPKPKLSSQSQMKLVLDRLSELEKAAKENPPRSKPHVPERTQPSRDRCLIIMNAAESEKPTPAERILDDQTLLERLVSLLFDKGEQGINIVSAFRLGKKQEDISRNRPLKIVCRDEEECRRILRRTSRLKGEPFYVLRDLSPEDRVKMKKAVEELRTRRGSGETDLHIVDFRVVRRTPKTRWRPILLTPGQ
ncbi:unnamed protein product [Dicrocoelium dendriticum]|nr:unnamed protein product [Dicrocoelium dendriticum]